MGKAAAQQVPRPAPDVGEGQGSHAQPLLDQEPQIQEGRGADADAGDGSDVLQ